MNSISRINILMGAVLFLSSCDDGRKVSEPAISKGQDEPTQQVRSESGMLEHMAGAAMAGAAAGSAGAVAHKVTDHVISKRQEKRSARRAHARGRRH